MLWALLLLLLLRHGFISSHPHYLLVVGWSAVCMHVCMYACMHVSQKNLKKISKNLKKNIKKIFKKSLKNLKKISKTLKKIKQSLKKPLTFSVAVLSVNTKSQTLKNTFSWMLFFSLQCSVISMQPLVSWSSLQCTTA